MGDSSTTTTTITHAKGNDRCTSLHASSATYYYPVANDNHS